jgi:uncharacterized protein (TIGR02246 family)
MIPLRRFGPLFAISLMLTGGLLGAEPPGPETSREAVTRAFEGLVRARNARDLEAVMSFFTKDALLSYPGLPDAGFDALHEIFRKNYANPDVQGRCSAEVEEVQVSGDLAFVRAVWTADLEQKSTGRQIRMRDKDLEIWRRQPDGSWKLFRGLSFPIKPPEP